MLFSHSNTQDLYTENKVVISTTKNPSSLTQMHHHHHVKNTSLNNETSLSVNRLTDIAHQGLLYFLFVFFLIEILDSQH